MQIITGRYSNCNTERNVIMKRNYMAEKCFLEIEKQTQKEILLNPEKRKQYMKQKMRKEYQEAVRLSVERDLRRY